MLKNEEEMPTGIKENNESTGSMDPQHQTNTNGNSNKFKDGGSERDTDDEDFSPSSYPTIHPLNTNTCDVEPETIRNSYRDDMDSIEGEPVESSPLPKRTVFNGHEHEETDDFLLSTMLAIRTAVLAGTRESYKPQLVPDDYQVTRKHRISMAGDRKVEVKDYAPAVFALLRRKFGISIPAYLLSWSDQRLVKSRSEGKSESTFVHSPDNKFVMKTLTKSEAKRLRSMLQQYYEYMTNNMDTFLSRIYGLHRTHRRRGQSKLYFAIFNNVFDTQYPLSEIYDLKGSTVGRRASCEQPSRRASTSVDSKQLRNSAEEQQKKPTVLKDLDFTRTLYVGGESRTKVLAQIAMDVKFLASHKLMDYSLLIGIVRRPTVAAPPPSTPSALDSPNLSSIRSSNTPGSSPEPQRVPTPTPPPIPTPAPKIVLTPAPDPTPTLPLPLPRQPRARHSVVVIGSTEVRVPGLLFFLESTKSASTRTMRGEAKKGRRKSISIGKPAFSHSDDLTSIDEEAAANNSNEETETEPDADSKDTSEQPNPTETIPPPPASGSPRHPPVNTQLPDTTTKPTLNGTSTTSTDSNKTPTKQDVNNTEQHKPTDNNTDNNTTTTPTKSNSDETKANDTPTIQITPSSPLVVEPPIRLSGSVSAPIITSNLIGNGSPSATNGVESEDGTPPETPELVKQDLGLITVSSVPVFSYYAGTNTSIPISKSGSVVAGARHSSSANSTPKLIKKPSRSSSLTYMSPDPLCENPYIPFYKHEDGGLKGHNKTHETEIYYIGIIDFLQKYNKKKKLAGFAKSFKYEREELSTVDPDFYRDRFLKMAERALGE